MRKLAKFIWIFLALWMSAGVATASTEIAANPYRQPDQAFQYVYHIVVKQNTGDPWAEYLLGKYYETGFGTKKNIEKAYVWYRMSMDNHYQPAMQAMRALKKTMTTTQIKQAEKMAIAQRDDMVKKELAQIQYVTTH